MGVDIADDKAVVRQKRLKRCGESRWARRLRRHVDVCYGDFRVEELCFDDDAFCDVVVEG